MNDHESDGLQPGEGCGGCVVAIVVISSILIYFITCLVVDVSKDLKGEIEVVPIEEVVHDE
jgi:hypothetical protein